MGSLYGSKIGIKLQGKTLYILQDNLSNIVDNAKYSFTKFSISIYFRSNTVSVVYA